MKEFKRGGRHSDKLCRDSGKVGVGAYFARVARLAIVYRKARTMSNNIQSAIWFDTDYHQRRLLRLVVYQNKNCNMEMKS